MPGEEAFLSNVEKFCVDIFDTKPLFKRANGSYKLSYPHFFSVLKTNISMFFKMLAEGKYVKEMLSKMMF